MEAQSASGRDLSLLTSGRATQQESEAEQNEAESAAAARQQPLRPQQQRVAALKGGPLRKADGRFMSRDEVRGLIVASCPGITILQRS